MTQMTKPNQQVSSMKNIIHLSFGEELGNSISHGVMALAFLILLPFVAVRSYLQSGALLAVSESIFMISMFLMFLTSTLYHSMAYETKQKYIFRILDHIFIYFAIAGSYTPIALNVVGGITGWVIFAIQWTCVLFGILYKSLARKSTPKITVTIYLIMGWIAVLFIPKIIQTAGAPFIIMILLGGVFYTIGSYFYKQKTKPYFHFIWHLFINAAAICHFIAIVFLIA